ncbi:MAG: hypothetical protein JWQ32_661 [Marmoricola sp.]|nr:hypothetical protein [Marmoricola sp.]
MFSARPPSLACTAAIALVCLLGTTACASKNSSPSSEAVDPHPTQTTTPAETITADPTATSTGSGSNSGSLVRPATLTDRLLATGAVPGLNATWHWQDGQTGTAGPDPFGVCAKVDLASIGATQVVQRTYFPPVDTDDNAGEQIAEFPDAATATRAAHVLLSWHDKCTAPDLSDKNFKVGATTAAPAGPATGTWYLATWSPTGSDEGRTEAFGIVTAGTRIAVLRIDRGTQAFHYPAGHDPMVAMVQAAAAGLS